MGSWGCRGRWPARSKCCGKAEAACWELGSELTVQGGGSIIPSSSVASTTDRTFVVRIRGGKAEWVDIRTGLTSGPLVEVFGDLRPGDEVAARGTDELRPGMEVRPREGKPVAQSSEGRNGRT